MQQNQENERPITVALNYEVRKRLKVSFTEYVLLDMVYHLSAKHGYCYKTATAIARDLGLTFTGVKKMIARLVERELLVAVPGGLKCASAYIDCAYLSKDVTTTKTKLSSERSTKNQTKFREAKNPETLQNMQNQTKFTKPNLVAVTKLSSDKNNNIDIHKDNLDKSKLEAVAPTQYGKPEINELFQAWQAITGYPISSSVKANRNAASNLFNRYGHDGVCRLIAGAMQANDERFSGIKIADFVALQFKLNELLAWGRKAKVTNAVAQF